MSAARGCMGAGALALLVGVFSSEGSALHLFKPLVGYGEPPAGPVVPPDKEATSLVQVANDSVSVAPIMMFAHGCSMTTAGIQLLGRLLQAHRVRPASLGKREMIKSLQDTSTVQEAQHNMGAFGRHAAEVRRFVTESSLPAKFAFLHHWADFRNETLVFKHQLRYARAHRTLTQYMVHLGTRAFVYRRTNLIDVLLCEVTDFCQDERTFEMGRAVDSNGTELRCAGFRGRGAAEVNRKPQVYLYPDRIVQELDAKAREDYGHEKFLHNYRFVGDLAPFSAEELLAFEHDADSLDASAQLWSRVLTQVGVTPRPETVIQTLHGWGSFPPPESHRMSIYNFEAIQKALRGTKYYSMLRP